MPTYDYECQQCGHRFEVFESIGAPNRRDCGRCRRGTATRMIGAGAGLLFRGSGFYVTDYKSGGSGATAGKSKSDGESSA